MLKFFQPLFSKRTGYQSKDSMDDQIPRYPPFPKGIPAIPVETLVDGQRELIQQIICSRGLAGDHNHEAVTQQITAAVTHYARLVHLLPASEKSYFRAPGGLFRFGLECGLFAIRYAERRILTRATPEIRKETERLWTHATFLAGLFSESILTISRLSVYSENGIAWHPGVEALEPWLSHHGVKNYHIRWMQDEDRAMAVTIAGKTIPPDQAKLLADGEKQILSTLMSALYNMDDLSNPIVNIIRSVRYQLIERDLAADSSRYGKPMAGMHLEPWLIDAMRHLLQNGHWQINKTNGRVWYGQDGLFLVWPLSAHDIRKELQLSKCPFVPNTMDVLAEIMLDAGILDINGNPGSFLFDIAVPQVDQPELKPLVAARLARPEILFGVQDITALNLDLLVALNPGSGNPDNGVQPPDNDNAHTTGDTQASILSSITETRPVPHGNVTHSYDTYDSNAYDDQYAAEYNDATYDGYAGDNQQVEPMEKISSEPEPRENPSPPSRPTKDAKTRGDLSSTTLLNPAPDSNTSYPTNTTELIGSLLANERQNDEGRLTKQQATSKPPIKNRSNSTAQNDPSSQSDLLDMLLSKKPPATRARFSKEKTLHNSKSIQDDAILAARHKLVLERLKHLPEGKLIPSSGGLTKIYANDLQTVGLDVDDCVSVLTAAGFLEPVDGQVFGLENKGEKLLRFFLVKVNPHVA